MKKLIFTLLLLLCLAMVPASMEARSSRTSFSKNDGSKNRVSRKFVLKGHVDPNIKDSCYNIYITDINGNITDADFVTRVPVKNKTFRFETELDEIKEGRIRAIFPGDELCSAWIDTYFIPGFTLDLTVHNGYYNINNKAEFNAEVEEWMNYYPDQPPYVSVQNNINEKEKEETERLRKALDYYQALIDDLRHQMFLVNQSHLVAYEKDKQIVKLCDQISKISEKMKKLIEQYAKTIK